jgi:hypothetical protein
MERLTTSVAWQGALLNIALWTVSFGMYIGPSAVLGRADDWMIFYSIGTCGLGLALCAALYSLMDRTSGRPRNARLLWMAFGLMAAVGVHALLDGWATLVIWKGVYPDGRKIKLWFQIFNNTLLLTPMYVIYIGGIALIMSSRALRHREQALAAAREAAQEAQLNALRLQINPHFLFNTLNAVTSLIGAGRNAEAEAIVVRLSEFFRASLTSDPKALVALEEEFDIAGSYLDIESARFGDRLTVDMSCPDALRKARVPNFLLQPLVENAVKHGVAPTARPVTITIRAAKHEGMLSVRVIDDGGAGDAPAGSGAGVGLANVVARLDALYGAEASLKTFGDGARFVAEIVMPLETRELQSA